MRIRPFSPKSLPAMSRAVAFTLGFASAATFAADRSPLPEATPESAGFSTPALGRIDAFFAREVEQNRIPGAVVAIARNGKLVYFKAHGFLDKPKGVAMPLDAVFNLASMTKVMVAVGALKLNEEGRLPLQSRLDQYFPAFGTMQVGSLTPTGEITLAPMKRPILIHDLFRHTAGFTYGGRGGNDPIRNQYPGGFEAAHDNTGPEFMAKLAKLPLVHQPGTEFEYSLSLDVLGQVVEKVTGQRLNDYMADAVWKPVGMPDTGFVVPAGKRALLAQPLAIDPVSGKPQTLSILTTPVKFDCAGACAFGTVGDYLRFGQMLLNGGTLDGHRVLSPKTVEVMTANHLGPEIKNNVAVVEPHREGYGFGLGVAVRMSDVAAVPGTVGDYTWNGANGTAFWVDPKEKLVVVMGTVGPGDIRKYFREQLGALVYGAMSALNP
jgi:CubicO group peptidase (beta-lactamase class C family)